MDIEAKMDIFRSIGEEIITEDELKELLQTNAHPTAYDGFEPSGQMHIAQGIMRAINTNKLLKMGIRFKFWVADWFAWANNKLGGDLAKIQDCGRYFIEIWKACGMDVDNVEFLWSKDVMADDEYWKKVMAIARNSTVNRIIRCSQIMGRKESEELHASQIFYPCMQCADIFHLKADIAQLGLDQRKVNMLARDIGPKLGFWKPVVVSSHMLMGLGIPPKTEGGALERAIDLKMSKSKPESCIFMTDSEEDIKRKVSRAYCPAKQVDENPILDYANHIIFEKFPDFKVERPVKFGGIVEFGSFKALADAYRKGELHPMDLKQATAYYLNEIIKPVREHFERDRKAKELAARVRGYTITR